MNRQFIKDMACTIKDEYLLRQFSPWWQNFYNIVSAPQVSYNFTTSSGTLIATGTPAKMVRGYKMSAAAVKGQDYVDCEPSGAPLPSWEIAVDDPIFIGGLGAGITGNEVRRCRECLELSANKYRVYLDQPLSLPHSTSESVARFYHYISVSAAQAAANENCVLSWGYAYGTAAPYTFVGVHRELIDFVLTPLRNPANPRDFFERWPGYVAQNSPLESQYRGMQPILDQAWHSLCERIRGAGYGPNKIMSLDQFCSAIYWMAAEMLCQSGHFPFAPLDAETTLERMRRQTEAEVTRTLSNILWYDENDDMIMSDDETDRCIGVVTLEV